MKTLIGSWGLIFTLLLSLSELTQGNDPDSPQANGTDSELTQGNDPDSPQANGTDCTQIQALKPDAESGIYLIQPPAVNTPFLAYCEMLEDGGWTVIQRRSGGDVSFHRDWAAYKEGFGPMSKDHWLGLERVFTLTNSKNWTLRVDLWDHEGHNASYAEYSDFRVGCEKQGYRLTVGAYSGDAGDAIRGRHAGIDQNNSSFSTFDKDNDDCDPCLGDMGLNECSTWGGDRGGWWYSSCGSASLNGEWHPAGDHDGWAVGLHWETWKGSALYSASKTRMMIKSV